MFSSSDALLTLLSQLSGEKLYIQSSDMGSVVVELNRDTELSGAKFVEVIGKVADSGETLREFTSTDLGAQGVDMNLVERAVDISTKFPKIFGGSADGDDDML